MILNQLLLFGGVIAGLNVVETWSHDVCEPEMVTLDDPRERPVDVCRPTTALPENEEAVGKR